nr:hypothetical protein MFMH1_20080 [Myxococcus sp. MH1]
MPPTPFYDDSTQTPQNSVQDLRNWWMPTVEKFPSKGYRAYKVQVKSTIPNAFTFDLMALDGASPTYVGLTVDLGNPADVWPGLPSTAVFAQVGQFGYLLLSEAYLRGQQVTNLDAYSDGKGKWPFGTDRLQRRGNAVRDEMLRSVSLLLASLAALQDEG